MGDCDAGTRSLGTGRMPLGRAIVVLLLVCGLGGCRSLTHGVERARGAYHLGRFDAAHAELTKIADGRTPRAPAAALDLAMVEIASGKAEQAIKRLRKLRDDFEDPSLTAPVGDLASLIADDNVRQYRPSGYEQVMIRSMLALSSLAVGDGDADSYALQAQMFQQDLARQAESRGLKLSQDVYQPLALAPYLRGVLRESTMRDYDDAIRAYEQVTHLRPSFAPAALDIQRCVNGIHSPPDHGALYVIALVGRGPVLDEVSAEATTTALQIASQVYSIAEHERWMLPNLVSIKVPEVRIPYSPAAAVSLDSSGVWLGATQPLVDVGEMAVRQSEAEMPWTLARAVARRVAKEVAVSQTAKAAGLTGGGREIARFASVNLISLGEHADTRCWGLLPREVQVLRAELPVGTHQLGMRVVDASGRALGVQSKTDVRIENGRNTYVTVVASDREAFVAR
ncbi:MAG: hypothetical protein EA381_06630 [Planctomycetaceae bacterium]|nr:MAG: hypothetical protein EA381_06630 [Planctomycetaceae bacterium]